MQPLARLRLRLTLWYVGIFLSILGLLGGGLFIAVSHRVSRQLDASLRAATSALIQAARVRETEQARATGLVADAVDELHIPDRSLYLFDLAGRPIKPDAAAEWIRDAAREAARTGWADRDFETPTDHIVRLHAERFAGAADRPYVAAVVADRLELDDEYASLIRAFAAAALIALLLVAGSGYVLVRKSTTPIEQSMDHMRRFMADAAHELRTPVTLLRTRAEVALGEDRDATRDAATFRQLLVIVLDNAVKFTPAGGHVRLDIAAQDGCASVVVADTGVGIPPEQLPRVFERFYRGEPSRHQADGAGLGLAIARWIAEAHGARIEIGSTPGSGTRVTISFPLLSDPSPKEPS